MVLETNEKPEASNDELSFAELLDSYIYDAPQRGQILGGVILEMKRDEIIIDVGLKRDAIVNRRDLDRLSAEVLSELKLGKEIQT